MRNEGSFALRREQEGRNTMFHIGIIKYLSFSRTLDDCENLTATFEHSVVYYFPDTTQLRAEISTQRRRVRCQSRRPIRVTGLIRALRPTPDKSVTEKIRQYTSQCQR